MSEIAVAVLGTGIMGSAMARNLVAAGIPTTVWDRSPAALEPLVAAGGGGGGAPAAAAPGGGADPGRGRPRGTARDHDAAHRRGGQLRHARPDRRHGVRARRRVGPN